jgi:hypothetical protein
MADTCRLEGGRSCEESGTTMVHHATYTVVLDDKSQDGMAALAAGRAASFPNATIPQRYEVYALGGSVDYGAFAQDFKVTNVDAAASKWRIDVTWKPLEKNATPGMGTVTPVSRPPVYSIEFVDEMRNVSTGWNVNAMSQLSRPADTLGPLVNAAGVEFDEPFQEEFKTFTLVARWNFVSIDAILAYHAAFDRTINSDTFKGYTKHKVKFVGIEAGEPTTETFGGAGVTYYPAAVRVAFSNKEWYQRPVNRGFQFLKPSVGLTESFSSEPILLKADGDKLPASTIGNTVDYYTREPRVYTGAYPTGAGFV